MSFIQKGILLKTFVESQFEIMQLYQFQTKANSTEEICLVLVWSYVSLWPSKKSDFLWRLLFSVRLKLSKFTTFKQKRILMKTFVESLFEVISLYEFQTKLNSYEHICWVSVWSYVSLWVSNQSEFSWRHLLSLSLKLAKFMSFKPKWILMKTFVESYFRVMWV